MRGKSSAAQRQRLRLLSLKTSAIRTFDRAATAFICLRNNAFQCTDTMTTKNLEKTVYTRITMEDFQVLNRIADEKQQTISQLVRKILIDSGALSR
jgi:hypothetical protein